MKAPRMVARLLVPEKKLRRVAALMLFMWYTVVRYTSKFHSVPSVPSFSNVSFPVTIHYCVHVSLITVQSPF